MVSLKIVIMTHMQYINDTCMTVVRNSCECLTTHSDDSHQTFVRESHNVRANVAQFNFFAIKTQSGLIYVAIRSHCIRIYVSHMCRIVRIAETKL